MRLAYYGDDFTGSTDTLATLARGGLRAMLFLGVPTAQQLRDAGPLEALGIAGAARSMAPDAMRTELAPVARFLATLQVPVMHYKTCSTFDSAPHVGSIGVAVAELRKATRNPLVAIVGGQPSLGRYCVFANLFAATESGGTVVRIDRHPTMRDHPVTPMHESDLRRHLARQGLARVASFCCTYYEGLPAAQDAALACLVADRPDAVLFDIARAGHLAFVGRMMWQQAQNLPLLMVGPSGATQALLAHWDDAAASESNPSHQQVTPADGPVFVLAGSRSPITARQVGAAVSYAHEPLDAQRLLARDSTYANAWIDRVASQLRAGHHVLASTAEVGDAADERVAPDLLAVQCGQLLARLLRKTPVRRVGIAGGDTSSHAMQALDIWGLAYAGLLAPGVAVCRAHSDSSALHGMEFMLKGGQMGPVNLFERLLQGS
jgi:3-oxoisoapionate kinase